jgi:hypothetical protein
MQSEKLLKEFSKFCWDNPELRFWQALAAWTGSLICAGKYISDGKHGRPGLADTFFWTEKDGIDYSKGDFYGRPEKKDK